MLQFFFGKAGTANVSLAVECIETVRLVFHLVIAKFLYVFHFFICFYFFFKICRYFVSEYQQKCLLSDNVQLVKFLLRIVDCSHAQLGSSSYSSGNQRSAGATGKGVSKYSSLWEVYTVMFTMLGEVFEKVGSSLSADVWQSTIEVGVFLCLVDCLCTNECLKFCGC